MNRNEPLAAGVGAFAFFVIAGIGQAIYKGDIMIALGGIPTGLFMGVIVWIFSHLPWRIGVPFMIAVPITIGLLIGGEEFGKALGLGFISLIGLIILSSNL